MVPPCIRDWNAKARGSACPSSGSSGLAGGGTGEWGDWKDRGTPAASGFWSSSSGELCIPWHHSIVLRAARVVALKCQNAAPTAIPIFPYFWTPKPTDYRFSRHYPLHLEIPTHTHLTTQSEWHFPMVRQGYKLFVLNLPFLGWGVRKTATGIYNDCTSLNSIHKFNVYNQRTKCKDEKMFI